MGIEGEVGVGRVKLPVVTVGSNIVRSRNALVLVLRLGLVPIIVLVLVLIPMLVIVIVLVTVAVLALMLVVAVVFVVVLAFVLVLATGAGAVAVFAVVVDGGDVVADRVLKPKGIVLVCSSCNILDKVVAELIETGSREKRRINGRVRWRALR